MGWQVAWLFGTPIIWPVPNAEENLLRVASFSHFNNEAIKSKKSFVFFLIFIINISTQEYE